VRESFQEVIPFLRPPDQSELSIVDDDPISTNPTTSLLISCSSIDKEILVPATYEQSHPDNDFDEEGKQTDRQATSSRDDVWGITEKERLTLASSSAIWCLGLDLRCWQFRRCFI
jgi:hypothetical protein